MNSPVFLIRASKKRTNEISRLLFAMAFLVASAFCQQGALSANPKIQGVLATVATQPAQNRIDENAAAIATPNNDEWWLKRHQAILAKVKVTFPDLIFIGDSITQNWEINAPPPWGNFTAVWNKYYGARNALNLGFNGDNTANVLWRIEEGELGNSSPRLVVLLIGANNTELKNWTAIQTQTAIDKILLELHKRLPNTHVLLLGILPSELSARIRETNEAVNDYLSRKYKRNAFVTYLDASGALLKNGSVDQSLYYEPQTKIPGRALHPNAAGQEALAQTIEPVIKRLLKTKRERLVDTLVSPFAHASDAVSRKLHSGQ